MAGMAKYPIFLELAGRRVVVVGAGKVAIRKTEALLAAGARLIIVAENIDEKLSIICKGSDAEIIQDKYSTEYLSRAVLVIAATDKMELNERIYKDCQQMEILCNVVDEPGLCDFFVPGVVKRGKLQIAVGTGGACPSYAGHLRKKLENIITEEHGLFLAELETVRAELMEKIGDQSQRKALLGQLVDDESFDFFVENGPAKWRNRADKIIEQF